MQPPLWLQAAIFRVLAALPARVKRLIAGPPHAKDGLTLEVDAQLVLRLDRLDPTPPVEERGPALARQDLRFAALSVAGRRIELPTVEDTTVAGLPARRYVPADPTGATLVYLHGGGWVVGDIESHDAPCRALAKASGAVVVSIDYRLAPEHRHPAAVDDAVAAFSEIKAAASGPVAVGGDSAGGHLAAMVAQRLRGAGGPALQVLIYPVTELTETLASRQTFATDYLLTKKNMDFYEEQFVSGDDDRTSASPLQTADLEGVAPAVVLTAGFDPLRDEGEAYARRLEDAGVPTVLRRHPGQIHGFINMAAFASTREAIAELAGVMRATLG